MRVRVFDSTEEERNFYSRCQTWIPCGTAATAGMAAFLTGMPKFGLALASVALVAVTSASKHKCDSVDRAIKQKKDQDEVHLNLERDAAIAEARREADRASKKAIEALIDEFHGRYFRHEPPLSRHHNRTTLFKCVETSSESEPYLFLQIYKRVGKYDDSDTTWQLDKNELAKCRGVAAEIWYHGTEVSRTAECDWPEDDDGSPECVAQKERYASSLKITLAEAERLKVKSRAFTGQPVWSGDRKWGVLLLDSLKEDRIFNRPNQEKDLAAFAIQLGAVLRRLDP